MLGLCLWAGMAAAADYVPMKANNTWVYRGQYALYVGYHPTGAKWTTYRNKLTLKVLDGSGNSWRIKETDSLYHRVGRVGGQSDSTPLKDSVIVATLELMMGDGTSMVHYHDTQGMHVMDTSNIFFYLKDHPWPPKGSPYTIGGTAPGTAVVEIGAQVNGHNEFGNSWEVRRAWYLDGVGLYWGIQGRDLSGACGLAEGPELFLESFNGKTIDVGRIPYSSPLAKVGKIACSIKPLAAFERNQRLLIWGESRFNLLGKAERIKAPGPREYPMP
jgi:hypothetical protein